MGRARGQVGAVAAPARRNASPASFASPLDRARAKLAEGSSRYAKADEERQRAEAELTVVRSLQSGLRSVQIREESLPYHRRRYSSAKKYSLSGADRLRYFARSLTGLAETVEESKRAELVEHADAVTRVASSGVSFSDEGYSPPHNFQRAVQVCARARAALEDIASERQQRVSDAYQAAHNAGAALSDLREDLAEAAISVHAFTALHTVTDLACLASAEQNSVEMLFAGSRAKESAAQLRAAAVHPDIAHADTAHEAIELADELEKLGDELPWMEEAERDARDGQFCQLAVRLAGTLDVLPDDGYIVDDAPPAREDGFGAVFGQRRGSTRGQSAKALADKLSEDTSSENARRILSALTLLGPESRITWPD